MNILDYWKCLDILLGNLEYKYIWNLNTKEMLHYPWSRISNPRELSRQHIDDMGRIDIVWWQRSVDCSVYFIEWEFCRIIPLSADRGISVGALYAGALTTKHYPQAKLLLLPGPNIPTKYTK